MFGCCCEPQNVESPVTRQPLRDDPPQPLPAEFEKPAQTNQQQQQQQQAAGPLTGPGGKVVELPLLASTSTGAVSTASDGWQSSRRGEQAGEGPPPGADGMQRDLERTQVARMPAIVGGKEQRNKDKAVAGVKTTSTQDFAFLCVSAWGTRVCTCITTTMHSCQPGTCRAAWLLDRPWAGQTCAHARAGD
jgi:hypothetical protein